MFLDRIVAQTRIDLEQRKQEHPLEEIQRLAASQPAPRDLLTALLPVPQTGSPQGSKAQVRLIAEIKRASPSRGMLAPHLDPVELARTYEAHGAAAISVLTEPHFFLGAPGYLTAIKQAVHVPVLRKDFIVDEYQVYEARAWGADDILLICESLVVSDDIPTQMQTLLQGANASTQVKICGLRFPEHVNAAVEAGADMLGFIFYEPSHRYIQPQQVQAVLQASERFAASRKGQATPDSVGVFVNKDAEFINDVVEQ